MAKINIEEIAEQFPELFDYAPSRELFKLKSEGKTMLSMEGEHYEVFTKKQTDAVLKALGEGNGLLSLEEIQNIK